MTKVFAERLRKLRTERGLSQQKLADMCGIGVVTVWDYENEKYTPTLYNAFVLADFFGVSLDWLVGRGE